MEPNNRQCRRFMVLGTARTGSNLLLSLLSGHPAIKTHGELFKLDALAADNLRDVLDDPIVYLRRRLGTAHPDDVTAVGFKMFYHHLTLEHVDMLPSVAAVVDSQYDRTTLERRFKDAWDRLIADRDLRVIHLKRRNMLDTFISLKTALHTQHWWSVARAARPTSFRLDPEECHRYFQRLAGLVASADDAFAGHATIEVVYENLVEWREQTLASVFAFLGVPWHAVTTRMNKQRSTRVSEVVVNYDELKESCRQTPWATFFE
jgi:LPS sulfotransferase NodH